MEIVLGGAEIRLRDQWEVAMSASINHGEVKAENSSEEREDRRDRSGHDADAKLLDG